jgi:fructosamine-3-kinase
MVKMARNSGEVNQQTVNQFEFLYHRLENLIPAELPSLLHGDLWSGNYMVDEIGNPCIIDPAVYYGHREVDLAMTRLFGGFPEAFYSGYHHAYPLENGWEQRPDIHNLYPLMVHVNLFGGGYISDVKRILNRLT